MGAEDLSGHNRAAARSKFIEAHRATAALLAGKPNDPDRIFAHSQSEFWIGYTYYKEGFSRHRLAPAKARFEAYHRLASQLVALQPGNANYVRELGYAEGNLCSIAVAPPPDRQVAMHWCSAALTTMERAGRTLPSGSGIETDLVNRHGWMADAWKTNGNLARAFEERAKQQALLDRLLRHEPDNMDLKDLWLTLQFGLAELEAMDGRPDDARKRLLVAMPAGKALISRDPANNDWAYHLRLIETLLRKLEKGREND
jgi:hypothetical protein